MTTPYLPAQKKQPANLVHARKAKGVARSGVRRTSLANASRRRQCGTSEAGGMSVLQRSPGQPAGART